MPDGSKRVSIRLSVDGAQQAKQDLREVGEQGQRSLDRIKDGADRASRALTLFDFGSRSAGLAGFGRALGAAARSGDQMAQSLAKLQNATGSIERASSVYEALYRNSLQTGVAVAESADAFQRFSIAAREIGATSDQAVRLVAGLQRVAIVSGATGAEVSSATTQLAQALASGVLQGGRAAFDPGGHAAAGGGARQGAGRLHRRVAQARRGGEAHRRPRVPGAAPRHREARRRPRQDAALARPRHGPADDGDHGLPRPARPGDRPVQRAGAASPPRRAPSRASAAAPACSTRARSSPT